MYMNKDGKKTLSTILMFYVIKLQIFSNEVPEPIEDTIVASLGIIAYTKKNEDTKKMRQQLIFSVPLRSEFAHFQQMLTKIFKIWINELKQTFQITSQMK